MSFSACCPSRPIAMRAATASFIACHGAPVSTVACHGWRLPPEGARCAAANTSASSAGSTGRSVKARTERRRCSASATEERGSVSVAGIFILAAFSEQQAAFEPGLELAIIGLKEDVILFGDRPADLGADRVGDLAHGAGVAGAQHALQLLQLIDAIDRKLGVVEDDRLRRFVRRDVAVERKSTRLNSSH